MYDRETVELALMALEEGMTQAEAAELAGAARRTVGRWVPSRFLRTFRQPHRPAIRCGYPSSSVTSR